MAHELFFIPALNGELKEKFSLPGEVSPAKAASFAGLSTLDKVISRSVFCLEMLQSMEKFNVKEENFSRDSLENK